MCSPVQYFNGSASIRIKVISDNHVLVSSAGRHRKTAFLVGADFVGKISDFKINLMGSLFDDLRWRLRLELLKLR